MGFFDELLGHDFDYYLKRANEEFEIKNYGSAKLEFEKALELISDESSFEMKKELEEKIKICKDNLAIFHFESGKKFFNEKDYNLAISELTLANNLIDEKELEKIKEIKEIIANSNYKLRVIYFKEKAAPFVERGDKFFVNKDYNQAIIEYTEALNFFKNFEDEYEDEIKEKLENCLNEVIKPYIDRATLREDEGNIDEAIEELEQSLDILSNSENINKINELNEKLKSLYEKKGFTYENDDEFISKEEWDLAINEYKEALNLYFNYNLEQDTAFPIYANRYEERYTNAKANLGLLYKKRGDRYYKIDKKENALKEYEEAIKFFTNEDFHFKAIEEIINELKKS
jgi:hypothetical protein